jgi:hypothetical protein
MIRIRSRRKENSQVGVNKEATEQEPIILQLMRLASFFFANN